MRLDLAESRASDRARREPSVAPRAEARAPIDVVLALQGAAGNRATAQWLGRRILAREHDPATLATGRVKVDAPAAAPPVWLTVVDAHAGPPNPTEVTKDEFVGLERAWNRLVGADGTGLQAVSGLQIRPSTTADPSYTSAGTVDPATTNPKHPHATGDAGTAPAQAAMLLARIAAEIQRSAAARELLIDLAGTQGDPAKVVKLFVGEHSTGFYDSAATFDVDITHERYLPEDPKALPGGGVGGVTRGELLMHVLEERHYMVHDGMEYGEAHRRALSPGSRQNRYRAERGIPGASMVFDCEPYNKAADPAGRGPHAQELQDFVAYDTEGVVTKVLGIDADLKNLGKMPPPSEAHTTVQKDPAALAEGLNRAYDNCVQALETAAYASGGTALMAVAFDGNLATPGSGPAFQAAWQFAVAAAGGDADQAKQTLDARWSAERTRVRIKVRADIAARKQSIEAAYQGGRALVGPAAAADPSTDPGSAFLLSQRRQREAAAVNDATVNPKTGRATDESENCEAVTLGAITLLSSTDLMQRYRRAHGLTGTAMKGYQSHVAWWEEANDPMRQLGGAAPPGLSEEEFHEALGDAQWYGAQETLTTLAAERTAASHGDITWSVEQFREPEIDPAKSAITAVPVAQLMSALQVYPNGTQFCLWLYAPPPDRMQHYVYAEKFSGRLVVEDYQPNKADPRKAAPHQHTYVDAMPNKSLGSLAPNYFTHGCFWALKPHFVKHEREQQMADREMRRLIRRGLPAH